MVVENTVCNRVLYMYKLAHPQWTCRHAQRQLVAKSRWARDSLRVPLKAACHLLFWVHAVLTMHAAHCITHTVLFIAHYHYCHYRQ
jgi:hypothetical protein